MNWHTDDRPETRDWQTAGDALGTLVARVMGMG